MTDFQRPLNPQTPHSFFVNSLQDTADVVGKARDTVRSGTLARPQQSSTHSRTASQAIPSTRKTRGKHFPTLSQGNISRQAESIPTHQTLNKLASPDATLSNKQTVNIEPPKEGQELDGKASAFQSVISASSPITAEHNSTMASLNGVTPNMNSLPVRPALTSQTSRSVPTTPHQHARDLTSRSRSPSPSGGLGGAHSPRSVHSEANSTLPTLRRGAPKTCPYESAVGQGSRRRIPYNIGDGPLEKAKETPKVALDPHEEDKLSGDMRELYDRDLLPSAESEGRRVKLVKKLDKLLNDEWPGNDIRVHVFGSSANLLGTNESDVDICITTPWKKLEQMHMLADTLAKRGMKDVICVASAKVPIVKIRDPELELACDMNVNNTLALENTRMIKTYVQLDERVRPLAMVLKYWTKRRILNDAAFGGTISTYTWLCMIINFLQTRSPPVLPALHQLEGYRLPRSDGTVSPFADDVEALKALREGNTESLGQLMFQFFRHYGHEVEYENSVVSVRQGRLLARKEKGWDNPAIHREAHHKLCVEEPFSTDRNLGNSADDYAFRGIHLEIRRAFDLLAEGRFQECCAEYEYPPEVEKSNIFERPSRKPLPVLTRSNSQSGRGGRGGGNAGRGNRNNFHQRQNTGGSRRSSSGASSFGNNRYGYAQSPPINFRSQEYFGQPVPAVPATNLHEHLAQQYHALQIQENHLKAQLLAQHHAHAIAQAQARQLSSNTSSPQQRSYVNGQPSPRILDSSPASAPLIPQYGYGYMPGQESPVPMMPSASQEGPNTQPSSPALANSLPALRRGLHRATVTSGTAASSVRSQSQPARALPSTPMLVQALPQQSTDVAPLVGYPVRAPRQAYPRSDHNGESRVPYLGYGIVPGLVDNNSGKEYLGYFMNPRETGPWQTEAGAQQLGAMRRISPELTQATLLPQAYRHQSRSPSPLGHHRSYTSTAVRATPLQPPPQFPQSLSNRRAPYDDGPIIANGSLPLEPSKEEQASSDEPVGFGPPHRSNTLPSSVASAYAEAQDYRFAAEQTQRELYANEVMKRQTAEALNRQASGNGASGFATPVNGSSTPQSRSSPVQKFPVLNEAVLNGYGQQHPLAEYGMSTASPNYQQRAGRRANSLPKGSPQYGESASGTEQSREISPIVAPLLSPVMETRTPSPTTNRRFEPGTKDLQINGLGISTVIKSAAAQPKIKGEPTTLPPRPIGYNNPSASATTVGDSSKPRSEQPAPVLAPTTNQSLAKKPASGPYTPSASSIDTQGPVIASSTNLQQAANLQNLPVTARSKPAFTSVANNQASTANGWQQQTGNAKKGRRRAKSTSAQQSGPSSEPRPRGHGHPRPFNAEERKGG